jgi:hypothetical protein
MDFSRIISLFTKVDFFGVVSAPNTKVIKVPNTRSVSKALKTETDFSDTVRSFNMLHHFSTKYEIKGPFLLEEKYMISCRNSLLVQPGDDITLYRAVMLFEKMARIFNIPLRNLQLLVCACYMIASKYEDVDSVFPTDFKDLVNVTSLLKAEKTVFAALDCQAFVPSPFDYLNIFNEVLEIAGLENLCEEALIEHMGKGFSAMEVAFQVVKTDKASYKVVKEFISRYSKSISSLHYKNVRGICL